MSDPFDTFEAFGATSSRGPDLLDPRSWDYEVGEVLLRVVRPKAYLVTFLTLALKDAWVPRSQVREIENPRVDGRGLLWVSQWMAHTLGAYRGRCLVATLR